MTYQIIKKNYERKLWSKEMVGVAVKKGIITAEQFAEITGETYSDSGVA